jgi:predicted ribosome quality control (RQC) complex YloA/Tae2 family protein
MDNFLLQAITNELAATLTGARLGKVYQLGATDLVLDFRLRAGRLLYVSTDPQRLSLYLTARSMRQLEPEARGDLAFPALIKKHLGGARLTQIEKLGYDRVVNFDFQAETETGELAERRLVVSLTGRGANVFLLAGAQTLASLRTAAQEDQTTAASFQEPPPPTDKLDPFLLSAEMLDKLLAENGNDLVAAAQKHLLGFTALYARELAVRAERQGAHAALRSLLQEIFAQSSQPMVYASAPLDELRREPGKADYSLTLSPIPLVHLNSPVAFAFPTVNQTADAYFTLLDERRGFTALRQQLYSHLNGQLKKQRTLRENLQRERAKYSQGETHQRYGELLLANLQQASKTATGFRVTDFYEADLPQIEIPAADKATAQEAAEHYFKLARKARHGLQSINARLPQIEASLSTLEDQLARLTQITRRDELEALAAQCGLRPATVATDSQAARGKPAKPKAKEERISGVRRYRSSDGYEILVGRTDRDNDVLTFRVAKSHDLWFHTADYPGSHVVLRNPQRQGVPPRAITEAAQLAAQFSQARRDAHVAVNYCERKFVSKQKGFAPGQVRLSSFKTILVEPQEAGERLLG